MQQTTEAANQNQAMHGKRRQELEVEIEMANKKLDQLRLLKSKTKQEAHTKADSIVRALEAKNMALEAKLKKAL